MTSRFSEARAHQSRLRDSVAVTLAAAISAAVIFALLYDVVDGALRRWTDHDLTRRGQLIAAAIHGHGQSLSHGIIESFSLNADVAGLVACSPEGMLIARSPGGVDLACGSAALRAAAAASGRAIRTSIGDQSVVVTAHVLAGGSRLFISQNRAFLDRRRKHILTALFVGAELVLVALLLLARAGARIGSRRTEEAARSLVRRMRSADSGDLPVPTELRLLVRDMKDTVEHLRGGTSAPRSTGAARLRAFANAEIPSGGLVVVANREPYAHQWSTGGKVVIERPASGLVSGIEPVLRTCGGTWIAYGSGSADRTHSDSCGRLAVPPDTPEYTLRRIWLNEEEYERYYSGLANEGLWPLCHMAHTQPAFRVLDWIAYQAVNETFARAAVEEASAAGLLLVQDYHFALVPRLVRQQAPHIVTSLFWHIPWPHSEVIGICPWKETLLEGMLGADVVGFHTRQFCLNFLETVQRYVECRVDFDDMSVSYGGHRTLVRAYPISVEWPYPAASREEGDTLRRSLGISPDAHVTIGVDRADYTKGLIERVNAVESLLEETPSLIGNYVLVQLASPSRTRIRRYRELADDISEAVERVNSRFGNASWKPIVLQMRTFSPDEVRTHYAMADSALVTPLHDGMNLVAKEYVAACHDGDGALILSVFAGASKELDGALLVNPYDTQQMAQAILRAIRMPAAERRARMQAMREQIASSSIYDWSERLLRDMCDAKEQRSKFWPRRPKAPAPLREVAG